MPPEEVGLISGSSSMDEIRAFAHADLPFLTNCSVNLPVILILTGVSSAK